MNIDIKKLQNDLVLLKDNEPWGRLHTKHALWLSFEGGKVYRSTVSSIFSSVPLKFFSVFNSTFLERYTNFDMPLNVQNFQYILSVSIEEFEKKNVSRSGLVVLKSYYGQEWVLWRPGAKTKYWYKQISVIILEHPSYCVVNSIQSNL